MVNGSPSRRCARRPIFSAQATRGLVRLGPCVGLLVFLAAVTATAAPPQNADPSLASWFRSLTNPVVGLSCCAEADGHILSDADWRTKGNGYEIRVGENWWPVPPETVLNHVPNPTGGAVAFWEAHRHQKNDRPPNIYCFVRPVES
jgi:hypothetical protein